MTTGIGDYVHYRASNYRAFSLMNQHLYMPDEPARVSARVNYIGDAQQAWAANKAYLQRMYANNITTATAKSLETQINKLKQEMVEIDKGLNEAQQPDSNINSGVQETAEQLKTYVEDAIPGASLDIQTLIATALEGDIKDQLQSTMTKFSQMKRSDDNKNELVFKNPTMYAATVRRQISQLSQALDFLKTKLNSAIQTGATPAAINTLNKNITKVTTTRDKLEQVLDLASGNIIATNQSLGGKTLATIFREFNKLVRALTRPSSSEMKITGEAGVAALTHLAVNNGTAATGKLIREFVKTANKKMPTQMNFGSNIINTQLTGDETAFQQLERLINIDKRGNQIKTWKSPAGSSVLINEATGLADIVIPLEEGSSLKQEFGLNELLASVKNYTSYNNIFPKGIGIQSTSLLEILMIGLPDFANHYLNLLASHGARELSGNMKSDYSEMIKFMLAVRGFLGLRSSYSQASNQGVQFFILNDATTGYITVISVSELLHTIEDFSKLNTLLTFENLPTTLVKYNIWAGGLSYSQASAVSRIVKLLAGIHSIKISAQLAPNFYTNINNFQL